MGASAVDDATISPAFRRLIEAVRADSLGAAAELALGQPTAESEAARYLGTDVVEALIAEGWLEVVDGAARDRCVSLAVALHVFNGLVSVLPVSQAVSADYVHLNSDSFWLLDLAWQLGSTGTWAAELGIGNGVVAAHLTARYTRVIGTDLAGPWMRCAQLTLAANEARGRVATPIVCDVAGGLRPGAFELVVSNTPWSPSAPLDDQGRVQTFMAGGPTGTELPSRFLTQAADLLAPGGVAIVLCFDPTFADGSRPLEPTLQQIQDQGHSVEVIESPVMPVDLITPRLQRRMPTLQRGAHVAVVIRRP